MYGRTVVLAIFHSPVPNGQSKVFSPLKELAFLDLRRYFFRLSFCWGFPSSPSQFPDPGSFFFFGGFCQLGTPRILTLSVAFFPLPDPRPWRPWSLFSNTMAPQSDRPLGKSLFEFLLFSAPSLLKVGNGETNVFRFFHWRFVYVPTPGAWLFLLHLLHPLTYGVIKPRSFNFFSCCLVFLFFVDLSLVLDPFFRFSVKARHDPGLSLPGHRSNPNGVFFLPSS